MAIERHYRILNEHPVPLWPLLAARPRAVGPRRQDHRASRCCKLLGGLTDRVPAYASSGTLRDPAALAEAAEAYAEQRLPGA